MRVAALDLGSNTFLLLIADRVGDQVVPLLDCVEVVRLAEGVQQTGNLSKEALQRARVCLTRYAKEIENHNVDRVIAVTTSAMRDAKNREEFYAVGRELNIPIETISGNREAELTYRGSVFDQPLSPPSLVIDVGGGSTEVVTEIDQKIYGHSLQVGSVRLSEMFVRQHPTTKTEIEEMTKYIRKQLDANRSQMPTRPQKKIVAVAGTPTTLACLDLATSFNAQKIHGHRLSLDRLGDWRDRLAGLSVAERQALPGMDPKRADVIVVGATILFEITKYLQADEICVSIAGVRYGVVLTAETQP